jgi:NADH:ubiquinone oxidoreductase subunit F (NADH-binding)
MLNLLIRITQGLATPTDMTKLENLCPVVKGTSLCGLGNTAPNPVLTTMKYFGDEYRAHVEDRSCPAGVCSMQDATVPLTMMSGDGK